MTCDITWKKADKVCCGQGLYSLYWRRGAETGKMVTYEQARGREKTAGRLFFVCGPCFILRTKGENAFRHLHFHGLVYNRYC